MTTNQFYENYLLPMNNATLDIPAVEVLALLAALAFCLVLRYTRSGIIIAYLFAYRWGWTILVQNDATHMMWYLIFGMAVGILTVIGMLRTAHLSH